MFTTMRHALESGGGGGDGGGNGVHRIDSRGLHVDGWLAMVLMHSNAAGRPVAQLPGIDEVKIIAVPLLLLVRSSCNSTSSSTP